MNKFGCHVKGNINFAMTVVFLLQEKLFTSASFEMIQIFEQPYRFYYFEVHLKKIISIYLIFCICLRPLRHYLTFCRPLYYMYSLIFSSISSYHQKHLAQYLI